mmetsp:Transcript_147095/g.256684  ORF Transcript_147095/g.256684 Transcript_147095/m.256684 type:complete len:335 (-) Transcript_147095:30-1034(-)
MIYILKGCKSICECPGETCQACAAGCEECTKGICSPVAECVDVFCNTISNIWSRPLGAYVFGTILSSGIMWAFVISAVCVEKEHLFGGSSPTTTPAPAVTTTLSELAADDRRLEAGICENKGIILGMFALDFFVFLLNIFFAIYIQNKVWDGLVKLVGEEEKAALTSGKAIKRRNVAQLIADSSKQVCLYDFCFCFYFFFLIGQLAFNWWMLATQVGGPFCDKLKWSSEVAEMGIVYPALVIVYSFGWLYFLQCHAACETCCTPCGGCTCCFGKRPDPEGGAYYDDDVEMVNPDEPVAGVLVAPGAQKLTPMPVGALPAKKTKKPKKSGGCSIS